MLATPLPGFRLPNSLKAFLILPGGCGSHGGGSQLSDCASIFQLHCSVSLPSSRSLRLPSRSFFVTSHSNEFKTAPMKINKQLPLSFVCLQNIFASNTHLCPSPLSFPPSIYCSFFKHSLFLSLSLALFLPPQPPPSLSFSLLLSSGCSSWSPWQLRV